LKLRLADRGPQRSNTSYADLGRGSSILGSDTRFNTNLVCAGFNYRF
jgi:hypothetical protein